jgi:2-C-methyl-D-erythritol 4-phosphate cytidylyltransferase/2-C-methyl-D-erythritol 4-phosphate cytidylyltransferase/2-C-methyl-D-erythritol 2,4-cyclodiphosphate synthase
MDAVSAGTGRDEGLWAVVITAAGSSRRMGGEKKEYRLLPDRVDGDGKPLSVLGAAASAFAACGEIKIMLITLPPKEKNGEAAARRVLPSRLFEGAGRELLFAEGGETRRASVHRALAALEPHAPAHVLIHDGARPWVSPPLIRAVMAAAVRYGAALPVLPLVETPKELAPAPEEGVFFVRRHLRRAGIGSAQTPQGFAFPGILAAHEKAAIREQAGGFEYTDDAEVWGEFCGPVAAVPGLPENKKITFPEDLPGGSGAL